MTTREASNAATMAELMRADVDASGRKRKLYQGGDVDGGTMTQLYNRQLIKATVATVGYNLREDNRERVDLRDTQEVQRRVLEYVQACELSGLLPGMSGLCGYSLHCSRQWLHKFKRDNPRHDTSLFLDRVAELFADCITNAAFAGASNAVMSLFVLKNNHGYQDKVQYEDVTEAEDDNEMTVEDIKRMLAMYGPYDDDEAEGQTQDYSATEGGNNGD